MKTTTRRVPEPLRGGLGAVEYFTFGFGSMIGVGWLVIIDDWLGRGGPAGAMLAFLIGGLALVPVARTYGRLVEQIPDAGAEIAYAEDVMPPFIGFVAGWTMVLAYAIVCPWEAIALGNLLARLFPSFNSAPLYAIGGSPVYAPRLVAGLLLIVVVALINYRGIRQSGVFQDAMTFGLLAVFALMTGLGLTRGSTANMHPLFARDGLAGAALSVVLTLQVVPYFLVGFESIAKGSEEASVGFDARDFPRSIVRALVAGLLFYVVVVGLVSYVYPWRDLVDRHVGTDTAFERAFGSRAIADIVLAAAVLSLLKVFNGNFVAATRMTYAIGRRHLVHPALGRISTRFGTPAAAIALVATLSFGATFLGDAVLVPITEVGALAGAIGWLSACAAAVLRRTPGRADACAGVLVSLGIVLMKVLPAVPGSFTGIEWFAFAAWTTLGLAFWTTRRGN